MAISDIDDFNGPFMLSKIKINLEFFQNLMQT